MTYCSYCDECAVSQIPAHPAQVCLQHAVEFWTGLLTYAREQHSEPSETSASHATCAVCMELTAARNRMMAATDAAGHPAQPPEVERVTPATVRTKRVGSERVAAGRLVPEPLHLASQRAPSAVTISASQWGISQSISR